MKWELELARPTGEKGTPGRGYRPYKGREEWDL